MFDTVLRWSLSSGIALIIATNGTPPTCARIAPTELHVPSNIMSDRLTAIPTVGWVEERNPTSNVDVGRRVHFVLLRRSKLQPNLRFMVIDRPISPKFITQNAENNKLKPLSENEISQRLRNLPNWTREGRSIKYTREFKNFVEAVSFVNCLISPSEKAGHHPDIAIAYNRVTISLTTHDAGGLTQQDFDLAATISKLASDWVRGNVCLVVEGSG